MQLIDSRGNVITLGGQIAQGGEGVVHSVTGRHNEVAKLYHKPPAAERVQKLQAMVSCRTSLLLELTCWPTDVLRRQPHGHIAGFLMPVAKGHKEVFKLYNPKSRSVEFQNVDWRFLIHSACNMARAFATMHSAGHVIGDVNHSSVMIAPDATVKLIDCDSFQIAHQGKRYLCEVGEPLHTAPELQGKSLQNIIRTPNHDNFGLAVLIFELLFMGRHPFAGNFSGGDLSLEEKIKTYRFAYGSSASMRQMTPPPNTLPLAAVSPAIAALFESAFSSEAGVRGNRPTGTEWVRALTGLLASLKGCRVNPGHSHWSGLSRCPWCEIEEQTGGVLFNITFTRMPGQGAFDLALAWHSICNVRCPDDIRYPEPDGVSGGEASEVYKQIGKRKKQVKVGGVLLCSIVVAISLGIPVLLGLGVFLAAVVGACTLYYSSSLGATERFAAENRLNECVKKYLSLRGQWTARGASAIFRKKFDELERQKQELERMDTYRQQELSRLREGGKQLQLRHFLDRHQIKAGVIPGIGEGRRATLASYGIDSAADIDHNSVRNVPGFGDQLTENLMNWRRAVERRFIYDPKKGIDQRDVQALENRVIQRKYVLQQAISQGAAELASIASQIQSARSSLRPLVDRAATELAVAKADLGAI